MSELVKSAQLISTAPDTAGRYTATARFLHWLSALVIIWASVTGLYISFFGVSDVVRNQIAYINVSATTLFIPFFIWRVAYRYVARYQSVYRQPPVVKGLHLLMYALVSIVLVSGVLMMDRPIDVFQWAQMPMPLQNHVWQERFETLHAWGCRSLAVLVLVHVAAVIKHQVSGKPVLPRML